MTCRQSFLEHINQLLRVEQFKDYAPNGLQIEGVDDIHSICTAVTASESVIDKAIQLKADALLVHHGYFWKGETPEIVGMKKRRIQKLLSHDINLFAYHLPLDCHKEFGNNACLAKILNLNVLESFEINGNPDLLWFGTLGKEISVETFAFHISQQLGRSPLLVKALKNQSVNKVAWCSGGAQDLIEQAVSLGADAYISGEISERTYYQAQEMNIHYFAAGHHATERYGIQALGDYLSERFGLKHHFIDSANPV